LNRYPSERCVPAIRLYFEASNPIPAMATIETPCKTICVVDPASSLCLGCGRSLAEIERWIRYSDAERTRIMSELPQRLEALRLRGARATAGR